MKALSTANIQLTLPFWFFFSRNYNFKLFKRQLYLTHSLLSFPWLIPSPMRTFKMQRMLILDSINCMMIIRGIMLYVIFNAFR